MGYIDTTLSFTALTCYLCGCVFAMESDMQKNRQNKGGDFWCPNGHQQCYTEPENEKLKKQLAAERAAHDQAKAALAEESARLAQANLKAARLRKRVANGVCPCCKRSFTNLARHMKTKHPKELA